VLVGIVVVFAREAARTPVPAGGIPQVAIVGAADGLVDAGEIVPVLLFERRTIDGRIVSFG
jgi:hypothetical protein